MSSKEWCRKVCLKEKIPFSVIQEYVSEYQVKSGCEGIKFLYTNVRVKMKIKMKLKERVCIERKIYYFEKKENVKIIVVNGKNKSRD